MKQLRTYLMFPLAAAAILTLAACGEQRQGTASREQQEQTGQAGREAEPYGGTTQQQGRTGTGTGMADREVTGQDRTFLTHALHGNMAEIEMARMVEARGSNQQVKAFAKELREDHEKANQQLKEISQHAQVNIPMQLPEEQRQTVEQMRGLSGAQLDRQFLNSVVQAHQSSISQYQQMSTQAQNPQLKEYASSQLPTLQEHAQKAQQLMGQMSGTGADRENGGTQRR